MIVPAQLSSLTPIYRSMSWDETFYVFPSPSGSYNWRSASTGGYSWQAATNYAVNDAVLGSDNNGYVAIVANSAINPVGDGGAHWTLISPVNLTGYTALFVIGTVEVPLISLTGGSGVTLGGTAGTVLVKLTTTQTSGLAVGTTPHFYLSMTDGSSNTYDYATGSVSIVDP